MRIWFGLLLALVASVSAAVAPTISTASLVGSTLTITGLNFGTKTTPAPFLFPDIDAQTNGTLAPAIGFDQWNQSNHPTMKYAVSATAGIGSSKSLFLNFPGFVGDASNGYIVDFGALLPASGTEVYANYWFKYHRVPDGNSHPSGQQTQFKILRAGKGNSADGNDNYGGTDAKYYPSLYTDTDNSIFAGYQRDYRNTAGAQLPSDSNGQYCYTAPTFTGDTWINIEVYYKYNTVTAGPVVLTDGIERLAINGRIVYDTTVPTPGTGASAANLQHPRSQVAEHLEFILLFPGLAGQQDWSFDTYISRPYIDTTQSRVFLCDSPTLSSCTGRFILPPSAWAAAAITATNASSIPAGYDYAYVVNSAGEVNTTGFTYTSGSSDTVSAAWPTVTASYFLATGSPTSASAYQFIRRLDRSVTSPITRSVGL